MKRVNNCDIKDISDLEIFDLYSMDLDLIPALDSDKNNELLKEIASLTVKLNCLFEKVGCVDTIWGRKKTPWIADKYLYCLENCCDKMILMELKELYSKYCIIANRVAEGNLRLVLEIAKEYRETSIISYEDIIQYGNMGLMRAVEKYSLDYHTTFASYARYWIKNNINSNIRGISSCYRVPIYVVYDYYKIINAQSELGVTLNREPTSLELSKYTNIPIDSINEMKTFFNDALSMDEVLPVRFGENDMTRGDMVADDKVDVYLDVYNSVLIDKLKLILPEYLTVREYEVLEKIFGLSGICYNSMEISSMLGISHQRVGEIKRKALQKLRNESLFMKMIQD